MEIRILSSWLLLSAFIFLALSFIFPYQERVHMMVNTNYTVLLTELLLSFGIAGMIVMGRMERREDGRSEMRRIYKILTEDERKALKEIRKSKSLSQDSLRFRMGWSKAKTSSIVTRLEKYGLIQRERIGKTYRLIPEDR